MPEAAVWVVVALLAILVAAAVPVLIQLRKTLATAEATMQSTAKRLDLALDEVTRTLDRVNGAAAELERGAQRVASLFEVLGGIGDALSKVRSSVATVAAIGASLGPMLIAAMRAAFRRDEEKPDLEVKP